MCLQTPEFVHLHIVFFLSFRDMSGFGANQYVFFGLQTFKKNESDEDLWQSAITERYQKRLSRTASQRGQSGREEAQREGIGARGDEGQAGSPDPCRLPCGG